MLRSPFCGADFAFSAASAAKRLQENSTSKLVRKTTVFFMVISFKVLFMGLAIFHPFSFVDFDLC
jgi:hypothetical protein